jgi:hypothetical protein
VEWRTLEVERSTGGRDVRRRLNYWGVVALTTPFIALGIAIGLVELLLRMDGTAAEYVVGPFLWAYRRKV